MRFLYTEVHLASRVSAFTTTIKPLRPSLAAQATYLSFKHYQPPNKSDPPCHPHHPPHAQPFTPRRLYSSTPYSRSRSRSPKVLIPMAGILIAAFAIGTKIIYHENKDPEAPHPKKYKEQPKPAQDSNSNSMSSKLIPSNPEDVMVIRDLTPNVVTFSVPFSRFGKLRVGGRATVGKSYHLVQSHIQVTNAL